MDDIVRSGKLVVVMDTETPGHFTLGDEQFGYHYELLRAYCENLGVKLEVNDTMNSLRLEREFRGVEADVAACISKRVPERMRKALTPVFSAEYVLIGPKSAPEINADNLFDRLNGSRLLIGSGFRKTDTYAMLADSLPTAEITVSPLNSFELVDQLSAGMYDYLICEDGEANLACGLVGNIKLCYGFEERLEIGQIVNPRSKELKADFERWLSEYKNSAEYASLQELYGNNGIAREFRSNFNRFLVDDGISIYDSLMYSLCEAEKYDWRFVSAIAYTESMFNSYIISRKGARGLMQIRPIVARQFGEDERKLMDPETNISLALKLMRKIERMLRIPSSVPYDDRMSIMLAGYNAGIGHVTDARKLAARDGKNPDSWSVVAHYLMLKSDSAYVDANDGVKCGVFGGGDETIAYVDKVMARYRRYQASAPREIVLEKDSEIKQ